MRLKFPVGQIFMRAYQYLDQLEAMTTSGNINVEAKSLIESLRGELSNINHSQQQLIESNQALTKCNLELEERLKDIN